MALMGIKGGEEQGGEGCGGLEEHVVFAAEGSGVEYYEDFGVKFEVRRYERERVAGDLVRGMVKREGGCRGWGRRGCRFPRRWMG